MGDVVRLGPHQRVAGRPFTDPERSVADLAAIRTMAAGLRSLLGGVLPPGPRPLVLAAPGAAGRQHRAILCDEHRLGAGRDLAFVGFFATRRPAVDPAPLTAADDELIAEFPQHPGILSYSSLEFADGNWGNLIVLDPPEAREQWRASARHARAAQELAPRHYSVVRLHHGVFPGGLLAGREPVLLRTRYLDFQGPEPWEAERLLAPA